MSIKHFVYAYLDQKGAVNLFIIHLNPFTYKKKITNKKQHFSDYILTRFWSTRIVRSAWVVCLSSGLGSSSLLSLSKDLTNKKADLAQAQGSRIIHNMPT